MKFCLRVFFFMRSGECLPPLVLTPWQLKEPSPQVTIGVAQGLPGVQKK